MIEMSVDKETVSPNDKLGTGSIPPPPQQGPELSRNCAKNPQQPIESTTTNLTVLDGAETLGEAGTEEQQNKMAPAGSKPLSDNNVAPSEPSELGQNGVQMLRHQQQQQQQQQRVNKRRSTLSSGFKHPVFGKRRRRANSESESVLPTNFLLGGNIFDPLNLNSLLDEEVNRALNAETPKSSPLPAKSRDPVEILIPRDITDPLNLNCSVAGDGGLLLTPLKSSGGRRRHRNRHHGGGVRGGEGVATHLDLSETESGKTCPVSQTAEGTLALAKLQSESVPHLLAAEAPSKESVELGSVPNLESQCPSGSTVNAGQEDQDEKMMETSVSDTAVIPVPHTTTLGQPHRQRKRRRTTSRSDNSGAPCWDKNRNSGQDSGFRTQPPGDGPQQQQQHYHHHHHYPHQRRQQRNPNQQKPQQQKFQYGNYNKYYGYRNPGLTEDPRLPVFKAEWFWGKEVLDLGCNTGHLTLSIAKNWRPARIVGLDIDGALIHAARQNIRHYLSELHVQKARHHSRATDKKGKNGEGEEKMEEERTDKKPERGQNNKQTDGSETAAEDGEKHLEVEGDGERLKKEERSGEASSNGSHSFPVSLRISRGPIAAPPLPDTHAPPPGDFPANVTFVKGNYVLESDVLLLSQKEEFDVILCLSVTKWVHLNWGDAGLKRFFQRVFRHLRPGGLFVLEPQPWSSYGKRKKLTETICKNYYSIRFKPDHFTSYLTNEVGFSSYELIGTPKNLARGFQRPVYVFHKGPARK